MKRQRVDAFAFDLSDVPPQPSIPKSAGHIKRGLRNILESILINKRINGRRRYLSKESSDSLVLMKMRKKLQLIMFVR